MYASLGDFLGILTITPRILSPPVATSRIRIPDVNCDGAFWGLHKTLLLFMQQYSGMFDLNLPIFLSSNNIVSILTHTHVTYYVEPFSNISRALHTYTLYYNNRCNVLFLDFRITILQILRRTRMLVKKNISYNINRLTRNDWQFK